MEIRQGELAELLQSRNLVLDEKTLLSMERLARRLLEENRRTNLTAVRDYSDVLVRHYLDSLAPVVEGWRVPEGEGCDVGTGAGFPGLVFVLLRPDVEWTLFDSKHNKIKWLMAIQKEFGLPNAAIVQQRAEELGRDSRHRERYDLCLARAVARGTVMLEYCLPLVRVGGELWSWQGEDYAPGTWGEALRTLGGEVVETLEYVLPRQRTSTRRRVVRIRKCCPTPDRFPRRTGIPKKRPL